MDFTQVCSAILTLLFTILIVCVIPSIRKRYGQEKIDEAMNEAKEVYHWITVFVQAAEQLFPSTQPTDKKAYVLKLIGAKLAELGLTIDTAILDAQIESAVLELHQSLVPVTVK